LAHWPSKGRKVTSSDPRLDKLAAVDPTRRDFLLLVAGALGVLGTASALWPFIDSLEPAADTIAAGAPVDVDLSAMQPGQQLKILWRGRPIFIVRRTPAALAMLQKPQDIGLLRDPNSTAFQQPDYAKNWHRSINPEYLVLVGICTHLGCIPEFEPSLGGWLGTNWPGGYFCPCHGSKYDLAGRVFSGVPAPYNLPVPPYRFTSKTAIRVGENPPNSRFDFSEIWQI
jgi:ubiquinol-cytochrome c reductase iron-sulfur subunit